MLPRGSFKFIYFWLLWVFVAVCRLSLVVVSKGYSLVVVRGLLIVVAFLFAERGLRYLWFLGSRAQAHYLWHDDLVGLRYVRSSWTRDQTNVPCIARRFLTTGSPGKPSVLFYQGKVHI